MIVEESDLPVERLRLVGASAAPCARTPAIGQRMVVAVEVAMLPAIDVEVRHKTG